MAFARAAAGDSRAPEARPAKRSLLRALGIELEEAGEDFVADFVGPAVAPGRFLFAAGGFFRAGLGLVVLVIEQELAGAFGEQVGQAVGGEDGGVHRAKFRAL